MSKYNKHHEIYVQLFMIKIKYVNQNLKYANHLPSTPIHKMSINVFLIYILLTKYNSTNKQDKKDRIVSVKRMRAVEFKDQIPKG